MKQSSVELSTELIVIDRKTSSLLKPNRKEFLSETKSIHQIKHYFMKGVVFTEFLEMVEKEYGYEMVDKLITENQLSSGGSYTAVGTYDHGEIVQLLTSLSGHTKEGVPSLLKAFGYYFFDVLKKGYPQFLNAVDNAFDFLESIETYIHVEVRKLYPDAELPTFETKLMSNNDLEMIYYSERKMSAFAEALIEKSMEYFGEKGEVRKENVKEDGSEVRFIISKNK